MSQSSIVAGVVLAAFIIWLAVNDRLQAYTAVLWGNTAAPKPSGTLQQAAGGSPAAPGAPSGSGGIFGDLLKGTSLLGDSSNIIEGTFSEVAPTALLGGL